MRDRDRCSTLGTVDANERVRVVVELQVVADTIRGQIAVENAPAVDFFGWLELINRLERASADRRTRVSAGVSEPGDTKTGHAARAPAAASDDERNS
jgi:hypothetical protein